MLLQPIKVKNVRMDLRSILFFFFRNYSKITVSGDLNDKDHICPPRKFVATLQKFYLIIKNV